MFAFDCFECFVTVVRRVGLQRTVEQREHDLDRNDAEVVVINDQDLVISVAVFATICA